MSESLDVTTVLAGLGLNRQFDGLSASVRSTVETESFQQPIYDDGQQKRFLMGSLMSGLRGLVPAVEVASALSSELEART